MSETITTTDLEVCVDCIMLLANGETGDEQETAAHAAKINALWGDTQLVPACDEDCEGWFSWSSCDGCGSTLGGDRHKAAAIHLS